jgi:hypothetical protein
LARIGPELCLIFRIGTQTKTRSFLKNGFTITFKCGTRIEMVLIYFSKPELEVFGIEVKIWPTMIFTLLEEV